MNLLITGHKGFIGKNAVDKFSRNHVVYVYDFEDDWNNVVNEFDKFDLVLHFGAISSTTEKNVEKVMRLNYDFTINLIDMCVRHKKILQYSSSASVYGLNQEFTETSPVDPRTPYAWSKYLIDRYASNVITNSCVIQGFRYFNVYGPHEEHKKNQASPYHQFEHQAKSTGKIRVFENSQNYHRDFIHVSDVLDIHEKFFSIKESGVWNVGTGKTKSFLDIAIETSIKYNATIEHIPMPRELEHSYQKYTCADLSKLNGTLL